MAVAPELLAAGAEGAEGGASAAEGEGAVWRGASRASGQLRRVPGAARAAARSVSTPSATAQTIVKLIWAVAVGLIVLEVAAQATGQTWSVALGRQTGAQKPAKGAYLPLYSGQTLPTGAALPGVLGAPAQQGPQTNLSGRAGGNLAVG